MDSSVLLERLKPHFLPIILGLAGVAFLVYGLTTLSAKDKEGAITFEAASDERSGSLAGAQEETLEKKLIIDVGGAVERPGVYELPATARVQDALIAAGGMSPAADREKVAQGLNLAAKLTDGGKIYIPEIGEEALAPLRQGSEGQAIAGVSTSSLININTASASELDTLQGVGPVTAEKIISNRPYGTIEELVSKKAVGQKVFDDIKDQITVY